MKKNIIKRAIITLLLLLLPLNVVAYSDYIIPGGENVGIEVNSQGVIIVGFYKVNGKYNKGSPEMEIGDRIIKINNYNITSISELINVIDKNMIDDKVIVTYIRNNKENKAELLLSKVDGVFKTGLYVKDSLSGIGTLTYIDPETRNFGVLGHEIVEKNTNNLIAVKDGTIFESIITGIDKSIDGRPGGKNAKFYYNKSYGSITKNTNKGVYGNYLSELPKKELMMVGKKEDVYLGEAQILTVLKGNDIKAYDIEIIKINDNHETKNIVFNIIDGELIDKAGGIVQGMSGSPIIQNDKIIGAVTHVIVDDVKKGYGIFITTMLEEGEI